MDRSDVNDKEQLEYAILDWSIYSGIIGVGYMYLSEYDKNKSPQIKEKINRIYYTILRLLMLVFSIHMTFLIFVGLQESMHF